MKKEEKEREKEKKEREKEIENLEDLPGIGPATAEKLREAGFDSLDKIAVASPYEIAEIGEISVEAAKRAINEAKKSSKFKYETAFEVLKRKMEMKKITTGSKELDALLGGGISTQEITEFFGKYSSGKSQIAFQLSVNVQLPPEKGGLGGKTLFVDSEGTFSPERINQMAQAVGLDPEQALKNIFVVKPTNSDNQILIIENCEELIKNENIKLIVIDSLTSHFRADYVGRGALADRQQKLNKHIHTLLRLAERYNLAVVVTNQVMDNPAIMFGDPTTPIGGHILAHASNSRIYLRRGKDDKRIARLVDSPSLPEGECVFRVKPEGIRD
ncbi:MAG: DNA repair and recombination protein RadA [Candidatus Micrarchaeia archaeon]